MEDSFSHANLQVVRQLFTSPIMFVSCHIADIGLLNSRWYKRAFWRNLVDKSHTFCMNFGESWKIYIFVTSTCAYIQTWAHPRGPFWVKSTVNPVFFDFFAIGIAVGNIRLGHWRPPSVAFVKCTNQRLFVLLILLSLVITDVNGCKIGLIVLYQFDCHFRSCVV